MINYTTREDVIEREIITPLGEFADEHDIDAIADAVLTTTGEGTTYRYQLRNDITHDEFWDIVADNAIA